MNVKSHSNWIVYESFQDAIFSQRTRVPVTKCYAAFLWRETKCTVQFLLLYFVRLWSGADFIAINNLCALFGARQQKRHVSPELASGNPITTRTYFIFHTFGCGVSRLGNQQEYFRTPSLVCHCTDVSYQAVASCPYNNRGSWRKAYTKHRRQN